MNVAVITGASSGMGKEFVNAVDKAYTSLDEIWVVARRRDRLEDLYSVTGRVRIRPVVIDMADESHIRSFADFLKESDPEIRMLVNSAGLGYIGSFEGESYDDEMRMVMINCYALTAFTKICLPYMHKNSRIINMASSASFLPQPDFAVYAASKSYVLSFSRALGVELKKRGIYVTAVCPGPVKTEFFPLAEKHHKMKDYKKLVMADPVKVVDKAILDSRRKKAVSIYSLPMQLFAIAVKIIPHGIILRFWQGED